MRTEGVAEVRSGDKNFSGSGGKVKVTDVIKVYKTGIKREARGD